MDKDTFKYAILGGIGWICICLGIYGLLMKGAAIHPIFENQHFINILFVVGIYLTIIEIRFFVKKAIALAKEKRSKDDIFN